MVWRADRKCEQAINRRSRDASLL